MFNTKVINLAFSRQDYGYSDILPKSLAIVPYFNGQSPQKHSSNQTSEVYLIKTVGSLNKYASRVVVTTCNDADFHTVKSLNFNAKRIDSPPGHLPIKSLQHFQQHADKHQYVFYTEGDMVWFVKDMNKVREQLDKGRAMIPYRLNRVFLNKTYGELRHAGRVFNLDDNHYVIKSWDKHNFQKNRATLCSKTKAIMFGGGWVLSGKAFSDIEFKINNPKYQVESACLSVTETGRAHKFKKIRFLFTEHLSTYDRRDKDFINLFPHLW